MRSKAGVALLLVASAAAAQNAKETCPEASERAQRLVDQGRLLEARAAFLSCAQESCPAFVKRDCQKQLEDLKANLPSIIVHVKDKSGSDVAHGAVSLDGTKIGELDGRVLELDPGTHKLRVELPDGRVFDRQIILAAGEHNRAVTFGEPEPPPPVVQVKVENERSGGWTPVRTIGFVGILAGSVSLVAGVVAQSLAIIDQSNASTLQNQANSDSSGSCITLSPGNPSPNDPASSKCNNAVSYHQQALTSQTLAIVLGGVGLVALVGGIVMFAVGGNKPATSTSWKITPIVGPKLAGVSLGVAF